MTTRFSAVVLVLTMLAMSGGCTDAAKPALAAPPAPQDVRKILADRVDVYKKAYGIVVATVSPQGTRFYSYGKLSRDAAGAPDENTVFELGPATAVFTSLLLAEMSQRGEVRLDDPLAQYLPAGVRVPEKNGRKITLVDLATHTSSLSRFPGNIETRDVSRLWEGYTVEQGYRFLNVSGVFYDIGTRYDPSEFGMGLLGNALATRAGADYETLLRHHILTPLQMTSTGIALTPQQRARLARAYDMSLKPAPEWQIPAFPGAGGLHSTAADLAKFVAAELGLSDSPLAPAMKSMLDVRRPMIYPHTQAAMGWVIYKDDNPNGIVSVDGGTAGHHAFIALNPAARTGVVVLANSANDISDIGWHLLDPRWAIEDFKPQPPWE